MAVLEITFFRCLQSAAEADIPYPPIVDFPINEILRHGSNIEFEYEIHTSFFSGAIWEVSRDE
jgi:hypothetical protein